MKLPPWVLRLFLASLPLLLSPAFVYLIAEDYLAFGGGDKDIVLILPYSLWAVLFLATAIVAWWKGLSVGRSLAWATFVATLTVFAIGLALAFGLPGLLGVS